MMNGRYEYLVTTHNPQRAALWDYLFGTDVLPVERPWPEELLYRDGRRELVYVLNVAQMNQWQINRLAYYIQRRAYHLTYAQALDMLHQEGWTIAAADCELMTAEKRPSFALWGWLSDKFHQPVYAQ